MPRMYRRPGALTVLAAAGALALAACSGGSGSPKVASLGVAASSGRTGGTSGASNPATQPTGKPTQLLSKWAACMRRHGDPSQAEPTIDANKVIHVVMLPSVPGGLTGPNGQSGPGLVPGSYCGKYLVAAATALRGDQPPPPAPSQVQLVRYAKCMRAHRVPDFPDPTAGGLQLHGVPGGDLDPNNPVFQNASKVCAKQTGAHLLGSVGPAPPGSIMEGPPGGPQQLALVMVSSGGSGSHG